MFVLSVCVVVLVALIVVVVAVAVVLVPVLVLPVDVHSGAFVQTYKMLVVGNCFFMRLLFLCCVVCYVFCQSGCYLR